MAYKKSNPNGQATMANSEPIVIASDQSAVPISGTVTANIGTVGTLSTAAKQDLLLTELQLKADLTETQPVSIAGSVAVTGPLTDTQLRATPVPVSGTVSTGGLTDTQLRATPLPVSNASLPLPSGASTSALQTTGNTSLSNIDTKVPALGQALAAASTPVVLTAAQISTLTPQTNALTDGQLRATPVPVSGTVSTGGLTDTQIRATPLPVSGTVTVSNPTANPETGLAKDGTDITTPSPAMPAGGVGIRGWLSAIWTKLNASLAVTGTFWQATQPVSGTFFQATQPVSIASAPVTPVTDNAGSLTVDAPVATPVFVRLSDGTTAIATLPVSLATAPTTPVTGTFWQATQPVSGTITANATLAAETTKVIGTVNVSAAQTIVVTQGTAANLNATATPIAITKGTQGATGFTVQRLNDAGRNTRNFMLDAYTAAPAVEAVQSVVQWFGNAAVAGTTQPAVVTAGKTLRLTHYTISTKSLATVGSAVVRIRANTAGLGVLASPLVFSMECGSKAGATTVAMTGGIDTFSGVFPEGLELPAGTGLAFSMAGYGPAGALALQGVTRFQVFGYEY